MTHSVAVEIKETDEPSTLYVHRPLTNAVELISWAKAHGFGKTLPPEEMHVTIAYSKEKVEWSSIVGSVDEITVPASDNRSIEQFGEGAVVLRFMSPDLSKRFKEFIDAGASYDFSVYKPHITISYTKPDVEIFEIEPYTGQLVFGPEVFEEIDDEGFDPGDIVELEWNEDEHPRDENGEWTDGGGGDGGGDSSIGGGSGSSSGDVTVHNFLTDSSKKAAEESVGNLEERAQELDDKGKDPDSDKEYSAIIHITAAYYSDKGLKSSERRDWRFVYAFDKNMNLVAAVSASREGVPKDTAKIEHLGSLKSGAGAKVLSQVERDVISSWNPNTIELIGNDLNRSFYERNGYKMIDDRGIEGMIFEKNVSSTSDKEVQSAEELFSDWYMGSAIKNASAGYPAQEGDAVGGETLTAEDADKINNAADVLQSLASSEISAHKELWRGMIVTKNSPDPSSFKHNSVYHMPALTATSHDRSIAEKYLDPQFSGSEDGKLFLLRIERNGGIIGHDVKSGELAGAETILPAGSSFRVASKYEENGVTIVRLYDSGKLNEVKPNAKADEPR